MRGSERSDFMRSNRRFHLLRSAMFGAAVLVAPTIVLAGSPGDDPALTHVAAANPRVAGISSPNVLSPELIESRVVQGSTPFENPTPDFPYFAFGGDGPMVPAPGAVQAPGTKVEASKSEPDKNTYLVLRGLKGADPSYDYGT